MIIVELQPKRKAPTAATVEASTKTLNMEIIMKPVVSQLCNTNISAANSVANESDFNCGIVFTGKDGNPVTTSLVIANGVNLQHKNVLSLIRKNIDDLQEFGSLAFKTRVMRTDGKGGQQAEIAYLNEQQATLLITYLRNSEIVKKFKKSLVKAFFDMRDQINKQPLTVENLSRMDILKLAMQSEEERLKLEGEKLALENQVKQDAPRVAFAKQVELAPDAIKVSEAAKILGTGQRRLFAFLRNTHWITRYNEPYQAKIEAGYLDVKLGNWAHPDHGLKQSVTTLITGKGLAKLQILWGSNLR